MAESNTPTSTPRKQGAKRKRSSAPGASTTASSSSRKKKGGGAQPSAADSLTNNNNNNNNNRVAAAALPTPPPSKTLIIDNGGDTIKYGWSTDNNDEQQQQPPPRKMPNVSARLIHQFTVLVGDEMDQVTNPNSLIGITRSTERGIITNLGNQTQVWKRILDIMGVTIPLHTEAATCFGWKVGGGSGAAKGGRKKAAAAADPTKSKSNKFADNAIPAHSIAVLLLFPPFYPRLLLDQIMYVWMEDFGVSHVGIGLSTALASKEHPTWKTALTVDMGWSACHVVPTFKKKPIGPNKNKNNNDNNITAIRRLPIGGRHMINILKYHMSYRQYNLMDQDHLLRAVLEQQAFLSLDLLKDLRLARQLPSGRRPYDRDYILPDYQQTHKGTFRLTPQLQKELELKSKKLTKEEEDDDEEEDEDFEEGDAEEDSGDDESGDDDDDGNNNKRGSDDEDGDDDDEEETDEQKRARLMRERAEAQRRRREQEEEEQVLRISVERFTVPEVLFRPKDAGLQADLVGLAEAIVQSIMATPDFYHAALFQNICVTGGLSKLPNLKIRLERELRPLAPSEYTLKIEMLENPIDRAWYGAKDWVQNSPFSQWSISKDEWEASGKRKAYSRLLLSGGGSYS